VTGEYSHTHGITVHEGPAADSRGTGWRKDAVKLEALNQRRIESPMQAVPNELTTIDKAHAHRGKSDEGTVDPTEFGTGGDTIKE
jgi:hypothetical protein